MFRERAQKNPVDVTVDSYVRAFAWYIKEPESLQRVELLRLVLVRYENNLDLKDSDAVNAFLLSVCITRGCIRGYLERESKRLTPQVKKPLLALLAQLNKMQTAILAADSSTHDPDWDASMSYRLRRCVEDVIKENTKEPNKIWFNDVYDAAFLLAEVTFNRQLQPYFRKTFPNLVRCALGHHLLQKLGDFSEPRLQPVQPLVIHQRGYVATHQAYEAGQLPEIWYEKNSDGMTIHVTRDLLGEEAVILHHRFAQAIDQLQAYLRQRQAAVPTGQNPSSHRLTRLLNFIPVGATCATKTACVNAAVTYLRTKQSGENVAMRLPPDLFRGRLGRVLHEYSDLFTRNQLGIHV